MSKTLDVDTALVLYLDAGHDPNGNPRRAYVVTDHEGIAMVIEEGYNGIRAIDVDPDVWPELAVVLRGRVTDRVEVTTRYYKRIVREYGVAGERRRFTFSRESINSLEGKYQFIRSLCNSVRGTLLNRVSDMPESWDGHELREIIAASFVRERSMRGLRGWSRRMKAYHGEVARRGLL